MTDERRKVVIFSGTSEGRRLSEQLNSRGIPHTVCVATEYGQMMQPKGEHILVEEGRKDAEGILEVIKDASVVVDATHPYARIVTDNIKEAAKELGVKLLRVVRDEDDGSLDLSGVTFFDTAAECAKALLGVKGNILLTTGSKELKELCSGIEDKSRIYARVLPSLESISLCEEAGIRNDRVIALQGPFSRDLNAALLRQYHIEVLVTKDSGKAGGFGDKILACADEKVKVFCIKRPGETNGISTGEALDEIAKLTGKEEYPKSLTLNIIGMGMGNRNGLTLEAHKALEESDVVFGAERLLEGITGKDTYPYYLSKDITGELDKILSGREDLKAAVLFSGDIGFYSGAVKFEQGINEWTLANKTLVKTEIKRFPGISSVAYLAARLSASYSDADIISLHGNNSDSDITAAANKISENAVTFVLLSSGDDVSRLRRALSERKVEATVTVASNLSYENEKITTLLPEDATPEFTKGLYVLYISNPSPEKRPLFPTIDDAEFIRNKTPMTKALIRHECVRLLKLKEGDVLYDVGSGTGSVAIEAAGLSGSLKVFSFEKKPEAIAVQKENLEKFSCNNILLIEGEAPDTFKEAENDPDAVFIGGSTGRLFDILDALKTYHKTVRVVITAITMETMNEILKLGADPDIRELEIQQITGSKAEKAGNYNLMKTDNSVMVAAFWIEAKDGNNIKD